MILGKIDEMSTVSVGSNLTKGSPVRKVPPTRALYSSDAVSELSSHSDGLRTGFVRVDPHFGQINEECTFPISGMNSVSQLPQIQLGIAISYYVEMKNIKCNIRM